MADDGSSNTPVTLVITKGTSVPPPHTAPHPPSKLSFTGFELTTALLLAALLLAVGSFLLVLGRRRRPATRHRSV
jgi:hypothetical protein